MLPAGAQVFGEGLWVTAVQTWPSRSQRTMRWARHPPGILIQRGGQAGRSGGETGKDAVDPDVCRGGGRGPLSAGLLLKMVGGPAQIIKMQSRGAPDPPPRPAPPFPLAVYQLNLARMKGSGGHPSGLGGTRKKSHQRVSVVASLAACSL